MEPISTGLKSLDEVLDGGLYDGLYIIGAAPSMGKTTLALQIADYITGLGTDVLFFTVNESADQLLCKNVSRMTFVKGRKQKLAKTAREIKRGGMDAKSEAFVGGMFDRIQKSNFVNCFHVIDFADDAGCDESDKRSLFSKMRREIEKYAFPVVIVDYIQSWAQECNRGTDKQNVDAFMIGLKRISLKYQIPVIALSALPRGAYNKPLDITSFKDSGQIECSSDVVLGLQYAGWDYKDGEATDTRTYRTSKIRERQVDKGREGSSQQIQVKMLKNRWGSERDALLRYYPKFNCFEDCGAIVDEFEKKIKLSKGTNSFLDGLYKDVEFIDEPDASDRSPVREGLFD